MKWLGIILSLVGGLIGVFVAPDVIRLGVLCAQALHPMLVRIDPALWQQAIKLVAYSGIVVAPIALYWPRVAAAGATLGAMAGFSSISIYHEEPLVVQNILSALPQLKVSFFLFGLSCILIILAAPVWFFWTVDSRQRGDNLPRELHGRCKSHA